MLAYISGNKSVHWKIATTMWTKQSEKNMYTLGVASSQMTVIQDYYIFRFGDSINFYLPLESWEGAIPNVHSSNLTWQRNMDNNCHIGSFPWNKNPASHVTWLTTQSILRFPTGIQSCHRKASLFASNWQLP